jgi:hypothetical protein
MGTSLKKIPFFLLLTFCSCATMAQNAASIATDVSILRSLSPGQQFWSFGQSVKGELHLKPTESLYAQVGYYTDGKYKNEQTATAKDAATAPQNIRYITRSALRMRHLSLGWKHYFKGAYNNETDWNFYGTAGFGLLAGRADNTPTQTIDTALYTVPQKALAGGDHFKRLTFDLSLGAEIVLGAGIYLYTDVRTWIPASDYPSPYLYNNNLPRTLMVNGGIRVLLD